MTTLEKVKEKQAELDEQRAVLAELEAELIERDQRNARIAELSKKTGVEETPVGDKPRPWARSRDDVVAIMGPNYAEIITSMRPLPHKSFDVERKFGFWAKGGGQRAITNVILRQQRLNRPKIST